MYLFGEEPPVILHIYNKTPMDVLFATSYCMNITWMAYAKQRRNIDMEMVKFGLYRALTPIHFNSYKTPINIQHVKV